MQQAHLDDLTFSDLRLLQILLRTESLTRASLTLGWSIPKASHRLSRIREALALAGIEPAPVDFRTELCRFIGILTAQYGEE